MKNYLNSLLILSLFLLGSVSRAEPLFLKPGSYQGFFFGEADGTFIDKGAGPFSIQVEPSRFWGSSQITTAGLVDGQMQRLQFHFNHFQQQFYLMPTDAEHASDPRKQTFKTTLTSIDANKKIFTMSAELPLGKSPIASIGISMHVLYETGEIVSLAVAQLNAPLKVIGSYFTGKRLPLLQTFICANGIRELSDKPSNK